MVLIIDNYDSFTFNIYQYFAKLGAEVIVYKNDEISIKDIKAINPSHIVISPGPCDPNQAGISLETIQKFAGIIPILGVCLGHQCIGQAFGGNIVRANEIMHGRTSKINHTNKSVFKNLKSPMTVTRYHSLVIDKKTLPDCLEVTAWSRKEFSVENSLPNNWQNNPDVEIMGIQHKTLSVEGIQFHPESILSEFGMELFANFLNK